MDPAAGLGSMAGVLTVFICIYPLIPPHGPIRIHCLLFVADPKVGRVILLITHIGTFVVKNGLEQAINYVTTVDLYFRIARGITGHVENSQFQAMIDGESPNQRIADFWEGVFRCCGNNVHCCDYGPCCQKTQCLHWEKRFFHARARIRASGFLPPMGEPLPGDKNRRPYGDAPLSLMETEEQLSYTKDPAMFCSDSMIKLFHVVRRQAKKLLEDHRVLKKRLQLLDRAKNQTVGGEPCPSVAQMEGYWNTVDELVKKNRRALRDVRLLIMVARESGLLAQRSGRISTESMKEVNKLISLLGNIPESMVTGGESNEPQAFIPFISVPSRKLSQQPSTDHFSFENQMSAAGTVDDPLTALNTTHSWHRNPSFHGTALPPPDRQPSSHNPSRGPIRDPVRSHSRGSTDATPPRDATPQRDANPPREANPSFIQPGTDTSEMPDLSSTDQAAAEIHRFQGQVPRPRTN